MNNPDRQDSLVERLREEPVIVVRAARCGMHPDCETCASAKQMNDNMLDELRAEAATLQAQLNEYREALEDAREGFDAITEHADNDDTMLCWESAQDSIKAIDKLLDRKALDQSPGIRGVDDVQG